LHREVLVPLTNDQPAQYQRYDWGEDRLAEHHTVPIGGIVLVEGVYALLPGLESVYDYKVWVDCPYEVRLARGLARDGENARELWVNRWMPAEERYVQTFSPAKRADLVVDGSDTSGPEREFRALVRGD
jgi:uridine kinase